MVGSDCLAALLRGLTAMPTAGGIAT